MMDDRCTKCGVMFSAIRDKAYDTILDLVLPYLQEMEERGDDDAMSILRLLEEYT